MESLEHLARIIHEGPRSPIRGRRISLYWLGFVRFSCGFIARLAPDLLISRSCDRLGRGQAILSQRLA